MNLSNLNYQGASSRNLQEQELRSRASTFLDTNSAGAESQSSNEQQERAGHKMPTIESASSGRDGSPVGGA